MPVGVVEVDAVRVVVPGVRADRDDAAELATAPNTSSSAVPITRLRPTLAVGGEVTMLSPLVLIDSPSVVLAVAVIVPGQREPAGERVVGELRVAVDPEVQPGQRRCRRLVEREVEVVSTIALLNVLPWSLRWRRRSRRGPVAV